MTGILRASKQGYRTETHDLGLVRKTLLLGLLLACTGQAIAKEITVAVASNFAQTANALVAQFEQSSSHSVRLVFGSTGKMYAQIKNGAPFDAFFSADEKRAALLEKQAVAVPGSRFTYATGKIVLWSPKVGLIKANDKTLEIADFRYLSIANPKLAPYGKAAKAVLEKRDLWLMLKKKIVRGENIGQAFQFVISGNADLGFVALSQLKQQGDDIKGSYWLVPQDHYPPIHQQAVLLKDNSATREFMAFVKSPSAREIIRRFGYDAS